MDTQQILDNLKKYYFWYLCVILLLLMLVGWWMGTGEMLAATKERQRKIDGQFSEVESKARQQFLPGADFGEQVRKLYLEPQTEALWNFWKQVGSPGTELEFAL